MDDADDELLQGFAGTRDRERELDALESRMLQACKRAYQAWLTDGDPKNVPGTLVKLMKDTHTALLAHVRAIVSDADRQNMTDEQLMLELSMAQERVRRAIEKKRRVEEMMS